MREVGRTFRRTDLLTGHIVVEYAPYMAAAPSLACAYETDPVLASAMQAPVVEWTPEEQALLDEAKARSTRWIPNKEFLGILEDSR